MVVTVARPTFSLETLSAAHVPAAAALVADRTATLRESVPALPDAWSHPERLEAALQALAARGDALAAVDGDGHLLGFQGAVLIDGHGGRWAYTADVAHAATGPAAREVIEALYARLAQRWVRDACIEHVVTVLAHEEPALTAFGQLGFGATVVDLVRDLAPVAGGEGVPGIAVRRAGPEAATAVAALEEGLRRHLASSPIFLVLGPAKPVELHRRTLGDPAIATFVATDADDDVVAFLRIGPSADDVATVVRDPGTASVTGAFTMADRRGEGVAAALLAAAVGWARGEGYVRCAVDHESANLEGSRFWRAHFTPVAYSLTRRLSPRLAR